MNEQVLSEEVLSKVVEGDVDPHEHPSPYEQRIATLEAQVGHLVTALSRAHHPEVVMSPEALEATTKARLRAFFRDCGEWTRKLLGDKAAGMMLGNKVEVGMSVGTDAERLAAMHPPVPVPATAVARPTIPPPAPTAPATPASMRATMEPARAWDSDAERAGGDPLHSDGFTPIDET